MKTSLNIEDSLFRAAQIESHRQGKTLSETISLWARMGKEQLKKKKRHSVSNIKAVDLGGPSRVDLKSRRNWMDLLET